MMLLNCGVGEDSWESLGLQGDQSWVFIGRTDAEAETPILWPRHAKSWLIGKDPDAARNWGQEEKGTTEDEMAGWHHRLDGHKSEWTLGVGDGQGGLACCDSWGRQESDATERLIWSDLNMFIFSIWFVGDEITGLPKLQLLNPALLMIVESYICTCWNPSKHQLSFRSMV